MGLWLKATTGLHRPRAFFLVEGSTPSTFGATPPRTRRMCPQARASLISNIPSRPGVRIRCGMYAPVCAMLYVYVALYQARKTFCRAKSPTAAEDSTPPRDAHHLWSAPRAHAHIHTITCHHMQWHMVS